MTPTLFNLGLLIGLAFGFGVMFGIFLMALMNAAAEQDRQRGLE